MFTVQKCLLVSQHQEEKTFQLLVYNRCAAGARALTSVCLTTYKPGSMLGTFLGP